MKHKLLIIALLSGQFIFFIWLGGLFLFNRTVFSYVKSNNVHPSNSLVASFSQETTEFSNDNSSSPIGIAVLTGGINRIEKAIQLLNEGVGDRLLISGVRPGVDLDLIASRKNVQLNTSQSVDLGYSATDTVGNAKEVRDWARKYNIKEFYVVTSFYHIPRSRLELQHELPNAIMHFVAVDTPNILPHWWRNWRSFTFMAEEYSKFLIVYFQYALDGIF